VFNASGPSFTHTPYISWSIVYGNNALAGGKDVVIKNQRG